MNVVETNTINSLKESKDTAGFGFTFSKFISETNEYNTSEKV